MSFDIGGAAGGLDAAGGAGGYTVDANGNPIDPGMGGPTADQQIQSQNTIDPATGNLNDPGSQSLEGGSKQMDSGQSSLQSQAPQSELKSKQGPAGNWKGEVAAGAMDIAKTPVRMGENAYNRKQFEKTAIGKMQKEELKQEEMKTQLMRTAYMQDDDIGSFVYGVNARIGGKGPLAAARRVIQGGLTKRAQNDGDGLSRAERNNLLTGGSGNLTQMAANDAAAMDSQTVARRAGPLRRGLSSFMGY